MSKRDYRVCQAFLPPMSGLAARAEIKLETGAINVKIGEGRTADFGNLAIRYVHQAILNPGFRLSILSEETVWSHPASSGVLLNGGSYYGL